jgi:hypothetical protein
VHNANKRRLDKKKVLITFEPGDMVMYYDHTFDTEGVSKLQWLYSGPHIIEKKCSQSDNLYWIRRFGKGGAVSLEKVNVNRLVLAEQDCGDLSPALGWGKEDDELREQPTQLPMPVPDATLAAGVVVGDMVAIRVEPDVENLPFAVGEVIDVKDSSISVWWYGPTGRASNIFGVWKPGFVDPRDNKRYYRKNKIHHSHPSYTSIASETNLSVDDIIGRPFQLVKGKKIPPTILKTASIDPLIEWSLPVGSMSLLTVECLTQPSAASA